MTIARTDQSHVAQWWFTVDRVLLTAILVLVGAGLVLSLAASPAMAIKRGLPVFYFATRHAAFAVLAGGLIVGLALLAPRPMRRLCLALLIVAIGSMVAVLWIGPEINGARRWLRLGSHSFQPSEVAKPAFVVVQAWLLAEAQSRQGVPALGLSLGIFAAFATLLVLEPDIGQTLLVSAVWGAMLFLSGLPVRWAAGLAGLAVTGVTGAYAYFPHVHDRIDRYLNPATGDNYQVERALQAIREGGLLGRGPGEGTVKTVLPDAHTDFIFAVIAEEYGAVMCLVIVGLIAFVTIRAFARALGTDEPFARNAIVGLALLFALQAAINMAVNTGLMPAKGMTLPFISYGGSSMVALAVTMGLLVGLARRPPARFLASGATRVTTIGHAERTVW